MHALTKLLHRQWRLQIQIEALDREIGERMFTNWRDRYIATLAASIRLSWECWQAGFNIPSLRSPDWCNAAMHLLTIADPDLQDTFLRGSPEWQNACVRAVLADGGVKRMDGYFAELPLL